MSKLNYDSGDERDESARTKGLRKKMNLSCVTSAISAGLFQAAMEKLMISKSKDRKDKALEFEAKQLMEAEVIDTPPPLMKLVPHLGAGGAVKRTTDEVGGFGADLFSQNKLPKEEEGGYYGYVYDGDACCKGDAYYPDGKVAGTDAMLSPGESSPGASTPSTEVESYAGGEEDDILDNKT
jgi:hypothetical protein